MYILHFKFSGAFIKLRKENIRLVMSVRLSVGIKQVDFHWKEFYLF